MPLSMDPNLPSPAENLPTSSSTYPATTKQATGRVQGVLTDVTCTSFSDKIMVTITQGGRLAQWIHVPLHVSNPTSTDQYLPSTSSLDSLLPMTHLTPKTLLGGSNEERETVGQLYAAQIATIIATKKPEEMRSVIVGLGLSDFEASREAFYDTVDLVRKCI